MEKIIYSISGKEIKTAKEYLKTLREMMRDGSLALASYIRIPVNLLNFKDMSGPKFVKKVKYLISREINDLEIKIILDLKTNESDFQVLKNLIENYRKYIYAITISDTVPLEVVKEIKEQFPGLQTILFCINNNMPEEECQYRFCGGVSAKIFFYLINLISHEPSFQYYNFILLPEFDDKTSYSKCIKEIEEKNIGNSKIRIIIEKEAGWIMAKERN